MNVTYKTIQIMDNFKINELTLSLYIIDNFRIIYYLYDTWA